MGSTPRGVVLPVVRALIRWRVTYPALAVVDDFDELAGRNGFSDLCLDATGAVHA